MIITRTYTNKQIITNKDIHTIVAHTRTYTNKQLSTTTISHSSNTNIIHINDIIHIMHILGTNITHADTTTYKYDIIACRQPR